MTKRKVLWGALGVAAALFLTTAYAVVNQLGDGNPDGVYFPNTKFGAYGTTAAAQPSGASQAALTDSSGGTASATAGVSANAQKETVIIPLGNLSTLANTQVWKVALPYAFTVSNAVYRAGQGVSTGSKLATLTLQINGATATGGVISLTSATATPTGATIAGTTITGNNTGTAAQTVEVAVSAVTAFVEGSGWVELTVVNTDKANQAASIAALGNAIRSALVTIGWIKGSS